MSRRPPGTFRILIFCLAAALAGLSPAAATTKAEFDAFTDQFLNGYYAFRTARATRDGVHREDATISGFTRDQILAETERLKNARTGLAAMKTAGLDSLRLFDHAILSTRVDAEILDLEEIRPWQKDPGYYTTLLFESLHPLATRSFAPPRDRLKNLIAREKLVGSVLAAAVENVSAPPKVLTEAAIAETGDIIEFLEKPLPETLTAAGDSALLGEYQAVNAAAIRDLQSYKSYLGDQLAASLGDFRLGTELFEKKLKLQEMCNIPVFRLDRFGDQELKRLQLSIKSTAADVDREKLPADVLRILSIDYPKPERLMAEADRLSEDLRRFCTEKNLLTLPAGPTARAAANPFRRSLDVTGLDAPGAFESGGRDYVLRITPPDPRLKPLELDDAMRYFNRYQFPLLVAAETWPGSVVEGESRMAWSSKVRKAFAFASFRDGWSAYVRQMLIEEGYAGAAAEYKLFQLRLALLDVCRFLAAIRMHTATMTLDEATAFFQAEAFLTRPDAAREARRAAIDPMSVTPLLGRLQFIKLRDDYRRRYGPATPLRAFHDGLLSFGSPPLRLLRQMLMPGDKGSPL